MERKKKRIEENKSEEQKIISIFGWNNPQDVANEIWKSPASDFLKGDLIFAFKGPGEGIEKLVIVYNFEVDSVTNKKTWTNFGVYMTTKSWSCVVPRVNIGYLEEVVLKDLTEYKADKNVISNYKLILENLKTYGN